MRWLKENWMFGIIAVVFALVVLMFVVAFIEGRQVESSSISWQKPASEMTMGDVALIFVGGAFVHAFFMPKPKDEIKVKGSVDVNHKERRF